MNEYPILWPIGAAVILVLAAFWIRWRKNRNLYDQRKENITFLMELLDNYTACAGQLQRSRGLSFDMGAAGDYEILTAPECMSEIRDFLQSPFSESQHRALDEKFREMNNRAAALRQLFPSKLAEPMCRFLACYRDTLRHLLDYQMYIQRKNQDFARICCEKPMTQEERILFFRDGEPRMELLRDLSDLKDAAYFLSSKSTLYQVQKKFRLNRK